MKIEVKLDAEQIVEIVREALAVQTKVNEIVRPFPVGSIVRFDGSANSNYDRRVVGYYEQYPVAVYVNGHTFEDEYPTILAESDRFKIVE